VEIEEREDLSNASTFSVRFLSSKGVHHNKGRLYYLIFVGPPKATCQYGKVNPQFLKLKRKSFFKWRPDIKPKCVFQRHPTIEGQILWSRVKRSFNLTAIGEEGNEKCQLPTEEKQKKNGWKLIIKENKELIVGGC